MIDNFKIIKTIGYGCSSKVFLVEDEVKQRFAAKVIRKDKPYTDEFSTKALQQEHEKLMKFENHPNFIKSYQVFLKGTFRSGGIPEKVKYELLEYAPNHTLSEFIRYTGPVEEEIARFFMCQLLHAVEYMHSQGIAHLDIKLENILLDEYYNIKLADLGSSLELATTDGYTDLRRGTRLYLPPEIENVTELGTYNGFSADVYTIGVSLFLLLTGEFPTQHILDEESYLSDTSDESNCSESPLDSFVQSKWKDLSPEVKKLIQAMLNFSPTERPTIPEIKESEWFDALFSEYLHEAIYEEMEARKRFKGEFALNKKNKK
jgi:serine/threonine protein kinase